MARPREFKDDEALDAAIGCFWKRGLAATSMRDLAKATGLNQPSLYNAFGDKHTLFTRALHRYAECSMRERITRLEGTHAPAEAIRAFFSELIHRTLTDTDRRGCMIVNTALEVGPHDIELRAAIVTYLGEIEAFFRRSLQRARDNRQIAPGVDPDDTARLLLGLLLGLRVAARAKPDRALLEGMVRPALALLAAPRVSRRTSAGRSNSTSPGHSKSTSRAP